MSGAQPSNAGPSGPARPATNGVVPGMTAPQQPQGAPSTSGNMPPGSVSQSNLNSIVIEYLSKKGYTKTEAMLRAESAVQDVENTSLGTRVAGPESTKYMKGFEMLRDYIEGNLDLYKADLRRVLWPVFVYSFTNLVLDGFPHESRAYFDRFKSTFEEERKDDIRVLQPISLPDHVTSNETAKIYRENKYRLTLSTMAFYNLIRFLESKDQEGGNLITAILQNSLQVVTVDRAADGQSAFAQKMNRAKYIEDFPAEDEGIPGHNAGSPYLKQNVGSSTLPSLSLGALPMEKDFMEDVRGILEDKDEEQPPASGQSSLVHHFERRIKREESEDAPTTDKLPIPQSTARDVAMEVQKVKEDRDRFKIEGRTGGVGPGVSVTMFTFHNTHGSVQCIEFSDDYRLVAAGMAESYIRVWSLDGKALPSKKLTEAEKQPSASRRLIGHSGSVYSVSFSPATEAPDTSSPDTKARFLLSSSADKTVRLWSLETWSPLVIYKGHDFAVWDVTWGPFGSYFLTGSRDKTARLWRTDNIQDLRIFAGHDQDVDVCGFHPNGAYVFTGSCDKSVRMWLVTTGVAVRFFTGHAGNVTALACSPSGKLLASADDAGTIILWDLASGRLRKRMRGHAKGGIWSLNWSVESSVLVSGGADGTVRVWDIEPAVEATGQGRVLAEGGAGAKITDNAQVQTAGAGQKKKGKDVTVTSDQISAFPTKKSPVYRVKFTRQNLVIAGGCYQPEI